MGDPIKVAVLGGGVGAMTAAYWLTQPSPGPNAPKYEVTIHQLGWRLGGKGASGRNQAIADRIEEHGLHIWFGFYANAFRMMRDAYDSLANTPNLFATWQDAFKKHQVITLMEEWKGAWQEEWVLPTIPRPGLPGDQTSFPPPCGYLPTIANFVADLIESYLSEHPQESVRAESAVHWEHLSTIRTTLREAAAMTAREDFEESGRHNHWLLEGMFVIAQKMIGVGLDLFQNFTDVRRILFFADFGVATVLGIIRDLCGKDWRDIDDQEWCKWLAANGMHELTVVSPLTRAVYDLAFGYPNGNATLDNANMAAGSTTCGLLRMALDYCGAIMWKMQAGMGDTIFTPLYELLLQRGVKFEFFHRVRDLVPSSDGTKIDSVKVGVQATTKSGGAYQPLVDVRQLGCWPSTPLYEQLVQGDELQEKHIDLEAYDAPWPDVAEVELKAGVDYDYAVFGLSIGALPYVCSKLLEQKPQWQATHDHVPAVQTQAFQFWLSNDVRQLGWPPAVNGTDGGELAVLGTYVEPLDTWADMSQLIERETWSVPVRNIAYFCGVLPDGEGTADVIQHAADFLKNDIATLWPTSAPNGKFNYQLLVVNDTAPHTDEERFAAQFFRANTQPTEHYVLTVAGSTKYRLDPANCGYSNLLLAGDWVDNGLPLGCVESAVLGGMKGVRNLVPNMVIVE